MLGKSMWNCKIASNSQILFSTAEFSSLCFPIKVSAGMTLTVSAGDMATIACESQQWPVLFPHPQPALVVSLSFTASSNHASAAADSPTCSSPVPLSCSLAAPRNWTHVRHWQKGTRTNPCAFCDKVQGSGDGCQLWHLNVFSLTWYRDQ